MIKNLCGLDIMIDEEDVHLLSDYTWWKRNRNGMYFITNGIRNGEKKFYSLHRIIVDAKSGQTVDHINGNTLDNQRKNLRICTASENTKNRKRRSDCSSGIKGVYYNKKSNRYEARIINDKVRFFLGSFRTKEEAANAYQTAALKYHVDFARMA